MVSSPTLQISVPAGVTLELRAAEGVRPSLLLGGEISVTGAARSRFVMNGLLIAYAPMLAAGTIPAALLQVPSAAANVLSNLTLIDCTLLPGWALTPQGIPQSAFAGLPTLLVQAVGVAVAVQTSILGAAWVAQEATLTVTDSIIDAGNTSGVAYAAADGNSGGGALSLEGCTVIGKIHASQFTLISNSIVWAGLASGDAWSAALWCDRKQQGCVRFSFTPANAVLPRQFECVIQGVGTAQPIFYSLRYGDPGYGKLLPLTDDAVRRGADDGGEMGAFHFVQAPQRENDLRIRLTEFLPVGLDFGLFYEN